MDSIKLRPHHLLCTQSYRGKGYSEAFVANMDQVVERLRGAEPVTIELTFSTDFLCSCCPSMLDVDRCETNEKVKRFDQKVVEYFQLEEKEYVYQEIIKEMKEKMTSEMLEDICGECNWYSTSGCEEKILS